MLDGIRVLSLTPGRIRFKIQERGRADEWITLLHERVAVLPGVHKIDVNQTTGSVLVLYDRKFFTSGHSVGVLQEALSEQLTCQELDRLRSALQSEKLVATFRKALSEFLSPPEVDRLHAMLQSLVT